MSNISSFRPIIIFAPSKIAGAEKVVLNGTNEMFDMNLNPLIIIIREDRNPSLANEFAAHLKNGLEKIFLNTRKAFDLKTIKDLKSILNLFSHKDCILHTHGFKALVLTKMANSNKIHVHTHHGNTSHTLKVRFYEFLADRAMASCNLIFSVSDEMTSELKRKFKKIKIVTVYNMVSFKNLSNIRNERSLMQLNESIQLVYIGRISPEKGLFHFLNMFSGYIHKNKFQVTILGEGPDKKKCEEYCKEHNLNNLISFVGFQEDVLKYLRNAYGMILPSFTEGMPMTVLESLSIGVPVIANTVGSMASLIENHKNGILVEKFDQHEWQNALNSFSEHYKEMNSYSLSKSIEFEEKFQTKNWVNKTYEQYLFLLHK